MTVAGPKEADMNANKKPVHTAPALGAAGAARLTVETAVCNMQQGKEVCRSWGYIYEQFLGMVIKVVFNQCLDLDLARDIAETVFAGLPERIREYDSSRRFSTWLCSCAIKELIDYRRSTGAEHEREARFAAGHPGPDTRPTTAHRKRAARETYRHYWEMLPVHERVIVQMHKIEGFKLPELSRMFDIPLRRVRFYMNDASRRMRRAHEQELRRLHRERLERERGRKDTGME
jgi:RNA polymerase sigma factor (sigma-70 family)